MNSKLLAVIRQEYLLKVRTRAFLAGTFLLPVLFGAMILLPAVFMNMDVGKATTLAVVDESGEMFAPLDTTLTETDKEGNRLFSLVEEPAEGRDQAVLAEALGRRVASGEIGGFLLIPSDVLAGGGVSYYARNVSDFKSNDVIERALEAAARQVRVSKSNLNAEEVSALVKDVPLNTFKVEESGSSRRDRGTTFGLAYVMGFLFYISLIIYGTMMLRGALEEKTSRSAEVMVATVRSSTLMGGKILGIGLAGLTQLGIWAALFGLFSLYAAGNTLNVFGSQMQVSELGVTFPLVLFFLLFFILGFLLYAAFFGALGAVANSETEVQQLQLFITVPMVLAFYFMFLAIRDPNGTLVRVASLFPLFTPIVMMVRICVLQPPAWEIGLSLVLLIAAIAGAIWVAGRIFRVGLLMYGKRPDLPELIKWIRQG